MRRVEIEARLEVDPQALDALPGLLAALDLQVGTPTRVRVVDRYVDSSDWRLRRAGWACRLRRIGDRHLCSLKQLAPWESGLASREEIEEWLADAPPDPYLPDGPESGPVLARCTAGAPLRTLFTVAQDRTLYPVVAAGSLEVEISADRIRFLHAGGAEEAGGVELELREGKPEDLRRLAEVLQHETGWRLTEQSKYERGLALAVAAGALAPPPAVEH